MPGSVRCSRAPPNRRRRSPASTPSPRPLPGLVMIAGGKLTTYRVMARDGVDAAAQTLREQGALDEGVRESITQRVPLLGASGFEARTNQRVALARASGLSLAPDRPPARALRWPDRRGAHADRQAARAEPAAESAPTAISLPRSSTRSRMRERATSTTYSLGVRTSPSRPSTAAPPSARPAAELMAAELGWDARPARGRGRPLPPPRRGRAPEPGEGQRPGGRRGARASARRSLGGLSRPR